MTQISKFQQICAVESVHAIDGGVRLTALTDTNDRVTIEITFFMDDTVRFRMYRSERENPISFVNSPAQVPDVVAVHEDNQVVLKCAGLSCEIQLSPFEWRCLDKGGKILWAQQRNDTNVRGSSNVLPFGFWQNENTVSKISDAFVLDPEERIYGFGEKFFSHDKRGHTVTTWNLDAYGVETERAYKNIPFFLSTRGYGVFINSSARMEHSVGDPSISRASYVLTIEDEALDYFVIFDPSFKRILKQYHTLTGSAPVPPKWAFGLWMSRCYFHNRQTAEGVAEKIRELDIPCDVLVFDGYWVRDAHQCDLLWDEERFPNPGEMLAGLKQKGFKSCVWEGPFVPSGTEMLEEGERGGYLLVNPEGSTYLINTGLVMASHNQKNFRGQETAGSFDDLPPAPPAALVDFTNPAAVRWIQEKHAALLALGVDVFKTDFGEQIPEDAVSPYSGLTGKLLHNLYAVLYNQAVFETTEKINGRGLVWARSAGIGSQKFPVHWGGDPQTSFSSIAGSLRGGLSLGLSGIPFWGSDIGGFFGPKPSPRLYTRWAQFGLLSTVARCHGTTPREPWEYGEAALNTFRKYAKLRYQLIPYIYSSAYQSSRTAMPLMRPLVLEWQDDTAARVVDSQYLLGDWLMVAPVLSEYDEREIYFPQGDWLDFWTGEVYSGRCDVQYHAPLEVLPLFIRRGAIIPCGPSTEYVGQTTSPITLMVFPGSESDIDFTDDDESVLISCRTDNQSVYLQMGSSRKQYRARFVGIKEPTQVLLNGEELLQLHPTQSNQIGWHWSEQTGLEVERLQAPFEIRIS